jgi:hypothetical protein
MTARRDLGLIRVVHLKRARRRMSRGSPWSAPAALRSMPLSRMRSRRACSRARPAAAAQAFDTGWGAQGRPNRAAISLGPDRDVKVIRAANIKVNGHRLRQTAYAGRPTGSLPYLNS